MTRILVVDDHMIIRKGLMQVLQEVNQGYEVDEASDGVDAMRQLRQSGFDAVLLDIALGERDGFDVLKSIRTEFPKLGVVMLSVYPEAQFAIRAIRCGAQAYLNKGCSPQELHQALQHASKGQTYLNATTATLLAQDLRTPGDKPAHERLSNRELQVMRGLAQGRSVSQLADQLSLSANTISTYRARIFEKLGVQNLVELLNYLKQQGIELT